MEKLKNQKQITNESMDNYKFCTKCENGVPASAKYCPVCGTELSAESFCLQNDTDKKTSLATEVSRDIKGFVLIVTAFIFVIISLIGFAKCEFIDNKIERNKYSEVSIPENNDIDDKQDLVKTAETESGGIDEVSIQNNNEKADTNEDIVAAENAQRNDEVPKKEQQVIREYSLEVTDGIEVVDFDPSDGSIRYKKVCSFCGNVDSVTVNTFLHGGTTLNETFFCNKCDEKTEIRIKCKESVRYE